ncbi:MAG: type II and III secretion system protein [Balneolales bacterium]|nr:type II and III secretion system protein [Balneolales bacterium]
MIHIYSKNKFLYRNPILFLIILGAASISVLAQDSYPREYTNPDEIVAFDRGTSYQDAMEVINQFYQDYRGKFIVDQTGQTGAIGTSLPAMHWEDALTLILRLRSLTIVEFDDYVEIVTLASLGIEETVTESVDPALVALEVDLQSREVIINATFFEGNRGALQEIGVDWSTLTSDVPENLNEIVAGEGTAPALGVPQTTFNDPFVSINSYNAASVSTNAFNSIINFGDLGSGISVQALFSAFEADNLGEVIATPYTKVLSGQEGRVQVGQDFSIKQRDIAGNVTDQFFSTGTILTVTPTVLEINDSTFIHLDVEVERSSAVPDEISTIITKQTAATQALLLNGEATTIAGLYSTDETQVRRGVPILKDLPGWFLGLRYLFGYNSESFTENELIIIVQARLEKTIEERLASGFDNKRTVLENTRADFRNNLDAVFENDLLMNSGHNIVDETTNDDIDEVLDDSPQVKEPEENQLAEDQNEAGSEELDNADNELTEEQQRLADELSLPVDNPELMVVVPRAFSIDEYLNQLENGEQVEDEGAVDLKYFIIGGSFIVKNNATRFNENLMDQGYDTRILFHPESRFNFVSYRGFVDFDAAVDYLRDVRAELNSEAWLFVLPDGNNE